MQPLPVSSAVSLPTFHAVARRAQVQRLDRLAAAALAMLVALAGCDRPQSASEPAPGATAVAVTGTQTAAAPTAVGGDAPSQPPDPGPPLLPDPDAPPRVVVSPGPPAPTLMFTASLKGYIEPCGCTLDVNLGGIDRVAGYVRALAALEPGAVFFDAGNTLFEARELDDDDREQALLKAAVLADGLKAMGALSTTPGPVDLALGVEAYLELVGQAGVPVTVANLSTSDGAPLGEAVRTLELPSPVAGGPALRIALIGVVDPAQFEGVAGVRATAAGAALDGVLARRAELDAQVVIVVAQGRLDFARALATAERHLDFVVLGLDPGEGDAPTLLGGAAALEAFNQGRHLGVLKLYADGAGAFVNARAGSQEALDRLDRRIVYLDQALTRAGPPRPGEESTFVGRKREELATLRDERLAMSLDSVTPQPGANAFAFFSVPMEPGYARDAAVARRMARYQSEVAALYARLKPTLPTLAEGAAGYVGDGACAACHDAAHAQWSITPHRDAYDALVKRQREHDPDCLRCHVTGYGQAGGAIVGDLGLLGGVQCEACHGPGGLHVEAPEAAPLSATVAPEVCLSCHDAQNSPRFDDATYRPAIVGPGHGAAP